MSQDTATLDHELKADTRTTTNEASRYRTGKPAAVSSVPAPVVDRSFSERLKGFFADMAKALEGDHESHKYRS